MTAEKNCWNCAHRSEPPTFENCSDCIEPELKGWEPAAPPDMHGELLEAMPPVELLEKLANIAKMLVELADISKMLAELVTVMRDMPKAMAEAFREARESASEESSKKVLDLLRAIEDGDFME